LLVKVELWRSGDPPVFKLNGMDRTDLLSSTAFRRDGGDCIGVTFSHITTSGLNSCYLIVAPLLRWDAEPGYASWTKLSPGPQHDAASSFGPRAGRSSDPILPYFAVSGQAAGLVVSIGWSGNWQASTTWNSTAKQVMVSVGHDASKLCTDLAAGEAIRTMRVVTVSVSATDLVGSASDSAGDDAGPLARVGFNRHRQLMIRHKLPRDPATGTINGSIIASWSWLGWPQNSPESEQLWHIEAVKNSTSVEMYWLDVRFSLHRGPITSSFLF
jgi:hypothetical protein